MGTEQRLLVMIALLYTCFSTHAQSAINLKVGIIDRNFSDESGLTHCGQSYGIDAIIEDSRVMFMPGLHYQQYAIVGAEERSGVFANQQNIHQISLPISIGTWVLADRWGKIRVYGGGHINFIVGVDDNHFGVNLDRVSTVHPGWQLGGQVQVWKFTADIRYYRDYGNVINVREESKVAGFEFLVGVAF